MFHCRWGEPIHGTFFSLFVYLLSSTSLRLDGLGPRKVIPLPSLPFHPPPSTTATTTWPPFLVVLHFPTLPQSSSPSPFSTSTPLGVEPHICRGQSCIHHRPHGLFPSPCLRRFLSIARSIFTRVVSLLTLVSHPHHLHFTTSPTRHLSHICSYFTSISSSIVYNGQHTRHRECR